MPTENIKRGVQVLDKKYPDWRNRVDSAILDLYSHANCVLGQLFESYYVGTLALGLDDESVVALGFDAENPADKNEYEELTKEWKRQINRSNS